MHGYKKLGTNMALLTIGSFSSKILNFIFVPFYTYVLTTEEYGTVDLFTTTISLLFPVFTLIIGEAMMRFALDKTIERREVFSIGMLITVIGIAAFLAISPLLMYFSSMKDYYWLLVLYFISYALRENLSYFVRGIEKIKIFTVCNIINTFLVICFNLYFLLVLKIGVVGYVLSTILASFVNILIMVFKIGLKDYVINIKSFNKELIRKMLGYSVPMIPNSVSWWVNNSLDKYMVIFFLGVGANGILSVAYKVPTILTTLSGIFTSAWRLSAVEDFGSEKSRKFFSDVFNKYFTMTIISCEIILISNKLLAEILYSKDFYQAWQFVPMLLIASLMRIYSDFFGTIYTSAYKSKALFISTLAGAGVNAVLNLTFIPRFGIMGAAFATMFSCACVFIVRAVNSRQIMKLDYRWYSDIMCFVIIAVQMFISINAYKWEYVVSLVCLGFLFALRARDFRDIFHMISSYVFRRKPNE